MIDDKLNPEIYLKKNSNSLKINTEDSLARVTEKFFHADRFYASCAFIYLSWRGFCGNAEVF